MAPDGVLIVGKERGSVEFVGLERGRRGREIREEGVTCD
jgi:hypothetical protein